MMYHYVMIKFIGIKMSLHYQFSLSWRS